jgi:hypothetical protein
MPLVVLMLAVPAVKSRAPPLKTTWEFDGIRTVEPGDEIVTTPPSAVTTLSPLKSAVVVGHTLPFRATAPREVITAALELPNAEAIELNARTKHPKLNKREVFTKASKWALIAH